MTKVISLMFVLLVYSGGCAMDAKTVNSQITDKTDQSEVHKTIKEKILEHAKSNFLLDESEADLRELISLDLPEGVTAYYLEKKGTYGSEFYNYLSYQGKLFCSKIDGDFASLLKDLNFLSKKDLTADQFWAIYQQIKFNGGESMLVDEKLLAKPYEFFKPFANELSPPKLDYNENGADFRFFTVNTDDQFVEKHFVKVSSDYSVKVDSEKIKK